MCQNANIILIILQFETIHKKRPFLYSFVSKEMVFSLLLGKTTYNLKVVNILICILTNPLLAYSSPLFHHQLTPSRFHPPLANCAFHSPPYGGGVGGGASCCCFYCFYPASGPPPSFSFFSFSSFPFTFFLAGLSTST